MRTTTEDRPPVITRSRVADNWFANICTEITECEEGYEYDLTSYVFDHLPTLGDVLSVCSFTADELTEVCEYYNEDVVVKAKEIMLARVNAYDQSEAVNSFCIGNMTYWLDKATRAGLLLRLQAEQAVGKTTTTLWAGTIPITLPMSVAMQFLFALENYASECYDRTAQSIAAIQGMDDVCDILGYEYISGYPEKLQLSI
jgi:hypothetical protein